MIGGFIVQGSTVKRVILRAVGPELAQYGVPNVLADRTLEVHDGTGGINGDRVRDIQDSGHAPGDPRESAIIANLSLGNYTGIVRVKNIIVGVTLVEVYDLE
jgi:hypothetical protein